MKKETRDGVFYPILARHLCSFVFSRINHRRRSFEAPVSVGKLRSWHTVYCNRQFTCDLLCLFLFLNLNFFLMKEHVLYIYIYYNFLKLNDLYYNILRSYLPSRRDRKYKNFQSRETIKMIYLTYGMSTNRRRKWTARDAVRNLFGISPSLSRVQKRITL